MLANNTINRWDNLGLDACAIGLALVDAAIATNLQVSNGDPTGIAKAIATAPLILRMMLDDITKRQAEANAVKEQLERARDLLREQQDSKNIVDQAFDEFNKKDSNTIDDAAKTAADDAAATADSTATSPACSDCNKGQADASKDTGDAEAGETPQKKNQKAN